MARMIGKAGWRKVFIFRRHSDSGRCPCDECAVGPPDSGTQRAREKRQWRRDQED